MKIQELFESESKALFTPVTVCGLEIFDPYADEHEHDHEKQQNTTVRIRVKSAEGKAVLAKLHDADESDEFKKFAHWADADKHYTDVLVRGTNARAGVAKLSKFIEKLAKPVKVKKPSPAPKIPSMKIPGVKVSMLQGWKSKLPKAIEKMGYDIEGQGYEDGSTVWSVAFPIDKKFNKTEFTDKLREELNFDGWLRVEFHDLVEEN